MIDVNKHLIYSNLNATYQLFKIKKYSDNKRCLKLLRIKITKNPFSWNTNI